MLSLLHIPTRIEYLCAEASLCGLSLCGYLDIKIAHVRYVSGLDNLMYSIQTKIYMLLKSTAPW